MIRQPVVADGFEVSRVETAVIHPARENNKKKR